MMLGFLNRHVYYSNNCLLSNITCILIWQWSTAVYNYLCM